MVLLLTTGKVLGLLGDFSIVTQFKHAPDKLHAFLKTPHDSCDQ